MTGLAKKGILQTLDVLGLNRLSRFRTRHRLLGLCYHGVIGNDAPWDDPRTWLAVSVSQFERQMRELRRNWNPIALSQLDLSFRQGNPLPPRSVFITFDDGYWNNLTFAGPILKKYEIPATIFLTTGLIGQGNMVWALELQEHLFAWPDAKSSADRDFGQNGQFPPPLAEIFHTTGVFSESCLAEKDSEERKHQVAEILNRCKKLDAMTSQLLMRRFRECSDWTFHSAWQADLYRILNWTEIRELHCPTVEFGAHTVSHCNLARVSPDQARFEMETSKKEIEQHLGMECFSLAYPFGSSDAYSDSVVETAKGLGFRLAATLSMRRNPPEPDPFRLDRLCVTGDLDLTSFKALISGWRNA